MVDDAAKAPFSAWPASLLCTVIHAATINIFAQGSKEQVAMSRPLIHANTTIIIIAHCCLHRCHDCHCAREQETVDNATKALSSMPLPPFVVAYRHSCCCRDYHCARG
jgi:hypothetical protein